MYEGLLGIPVTDVKFDAVSDTSGDDGREGWWEGGRRGEVGDRWVCSRGRRNKGTTVKQKTFVSVCVNLLDHFSEHTSDF